MAWIDFMLTTSQWIVWALLALVVVYVLVRAASFAHFRTKLEYFRQMIKELDKGDPNGKGR